MLYNWMLKWHAIASDQTTKLKQWGLAGGVSYGALNTLYYSVAFVACWVYVADVPQGQGLTAATAAFARVFATVWAGSQVTKLPRAGLALLMAPAVDRGLNVAVERLNLGTKRNAFFIFLATCLSFVACLFGVIVAAWC
ncbi:hypothetical protein FOA52_004937 [Chlamydomonas sp. UWO 241]|nr:hypothetical protein FOA52_004937 [Chlamydomonas sp. UWO 241]